ncbi:MAG: hypothetical protein U9N04_01945 [Patescibacteria group bacterium]|nr:hypothetical protein [Patescibacteria group bacterium]
MFFIVVSILAGDDFVKDYKDYEVWTTNKEPEFWIYRLCPCTSKMRTEEGTVIRTDKTIGEIEKHFSGVWTEVLSVTECKKTKNQKLRII